MAGLPQGPPRARARQSGERQRYDVHAPERLRGRTENVHHGGPDDRWMRHCGDALARATQSIQPRAHASQEVVYGLAAVWRRAEIGQPARVRDFAEGPPAPLPEVEVR